MISYRAVMLQGQGGPEKLEVVELPLPPPSAEAGASNQTVWPVGHAVRP
jgi:hypothetical protein